VTPQLEEKVLRFFLLTRLNVSEAVSCAQKVIKRYKAQSLSHNDGDDVVKLLKILIETSNSLAAIKGQNSVKDLLNLNHAIDFESWKKFILSSHIVSIQSLVLCEILGFSREQLAQSIENNVKNMSYRISKAHLHLGQIINSNGLRF
jgi:hypothetical protein